MYEKYNPNPLGKNVGDCTVRAIAKALNVDWGAAYMLLTAKGYEMADMPSADAVWGAVLRSDGYRKYVLPDTCPDCYTAADFARDYPRDTYVLGFGGHVATMIDGTLYDSWNSLSEVPIYYWSKR